MRICRSKNILFSLNDQNNEQIIQKALSAFTLCIKNKKQLSEKILLICYKKNVNYIGMPTSEKAGAERFSIWGQLAM